MDLEIIIEGMTDVGLEKAIKQRIQEVYAGGPRDGWRSVFIAPSETRGEWDLSVRSGAGRTFASFVDGAERLPELVGAQLRSWFQKGH
jgi:hypothetical protein